jgi:aspartyl-tRNA(Asn)/glutamyl-tRNA(Gln) amidotransferase subunit A
MSLTRGLAVDLCAARGEILSGATSALAQLEMAHAAAASDAAAHSFIRRFDAMARAAAVGVDQALAAGAPLPALAGLAISIKDLFDVQGVVTSAGSQVLQDEPAAAQDGPLVARLRAAGAALVGHTNMSEFAYSGVGINPHFGTPVNAATATLDAAPRAPGGSTSGGATSVASGSAWAALGSDTGGSIRIPAALQGLVGFKNTQRLTPLAGSVPLSSTLDTACAITRSVRDAVLLHEVLAQRQVVLRGRPVRSLRLGVPTTLMLDDLEPAVAAALRAAGASIEEFALPPLLELAGLQATGGFAAAQSWAWHRTRLAQHRDRYDPRVAARIARGEAMSAADYIALHEARRAWMQKVHARSEGFDALLSPTVPLVAPALAPLLHDDAAFFAVNARLLRNPAVVNFLDGCALSLPCQGAGELPIGLMVWGTALCDDTVLDVSLAIEAALARIVAPIDARAGG